MLLVMVSNGNKGSAMKNKQRVEAIDACNRIIAANERLQKIAADIKRGSEELRAIWANPNRMPKDGDSVEGDLTGEV